MHKSASTHNPNQIENNFQLRNWKLFFVEGAWATKSAKGVKAIQKELTLAQFKMPSLVANWLDTPLVTPFYELAKCKISIFVILLQIIYIFV